MFGNDPIATALTEAATFEGQSAPILALARAALARGETLFPAALRELALIARYPVRGPAVWEAEHLLRY